MKRKYILWIQFFAWTLVIFALCTMPVPKTNVSGSIPHLDKIAHFGLFFLSVIFTYPLLRFYIRNKVIATVTMLLFVGIYGSVIEWLQGTYFHRTADIWDWIADVLGGVFGIILYSFICNIKNKLYKYFQKLFW